MVGTGLMHLKELMKPVYSQPEEIVSSSSRIEYPLQSIHAEIFWYASSTTSCECILSMEPSAADF